MEFSRDKDYTTPFKSLRQCLQLLSESPLGLNMSFFSPFTPVLFLGETEQSGHYLLCIDVNKFQGKSTVIFIYFLNHYLFHF